MLWDHRPAPREVRPSRFHRASLVGENHIEVLSGNQANGFGCPFRLNNHVRISAEVHIKYPPHAWLIVNYQHFSHIVPPSSALDPRQSELSL